MGAGVVLIGVFDIIFRTGDQNFFYTPDIFNVMGKLTHQNIKSVGILNIFRTVIRLFL
ncbi:Uncharacterised protein [Klebsiella pneumoniae]|nr:Uncharacterised protein [Klebsiella pneumoniae]